MSETARLIREKADIVEVVSEHVVLRRSGRNYLGLCPFHGEKTPSFNVNRERGIFRCFGCGIGGDVFTFLQRFLNIPFHEAMKLLAERYNVPIEVSPREKEERDDRRVLREVNELAWQFFAERLRASEGNAARSYLEGRGLPADTWERFGLGYAPESWDSLHRFLNAKKVPASLQEQAGLVIERQTGGYYDRFRHRAIFPIRSDRGAILGFGGRVLGTDEPKYMNSPETALYQKGRVLYGLDQAKDAIREKGRALLVEGYLDVITAHLHGFPETVGSLGTALTPFQARALLRYAGKVVVAYDSDKAGVLAAQRGVETLEEVARGVGIELSILQIPAGKDPDGFLRMNGAEAFRDLLDAALPLPEFLLETAIGGEAETPEGKARAIQRALPILRKIPSLVERDERIRRLAERLKVREESIRLEIGRIFRHNSKPSNRAISGAVKDRTTRAEEGLLYLMVEHPSTRECVLSRLKEIPFRESTCQLISERIEEGNVSWPTLLEQTKEPEAQALLSALMFSEEPQGWPDLDQMGSAFITVVELHHWEERKAQLGQELMKAEDEDRAELGRQFQQAAMRSMELNGIIQGLRMPLDTEVQVR
ncbi:MAG: DNA primase [Bacteroidota bacterium]